MQRTAALLLRVALLWPSIASASGLADPSLGIAEAPLELPSLRPAGNADLSRQALFDRKDQVPLFRGEVGGSVDGYLRPVYRTVENAADGVYDLMRKYFVNVLFPGGLSRGLSASPDTDSYAVYRRELSAKEDRFARQMLETYPAGVTGDGFHTPSQLQQWQNWAREEQVSILIDSFHDAMLDRHQLDAFGRLSGDYARDTDHWDPGFLTMSALVGGTFLYLNGLHAAIPLADMRVGLDLRSARRMRAALESRGSASRMGSVELGWRNKPLVLTASWGLKSGRLVGDQVGLNYRLRY